MPTIMIKYKNIVGDARLSNTGSLDDIGGRGGGVPMSVTSMPEKSWAGPKNRDFLV